MMQGRGRSADNFRGSSPRPAEKQARRARCAAADGPGKTFGEFYAAGRSFPIVQLGVLSADGPPKTFFGGRQRPADLSSGLGYRRGRSAEKTRGRPTSRLVELDVPPGRRWKTSRDFSGRDALRPAWGPAAEGPGREHFRDGPGKTSPRPAEKPARRARCPAADGPPGKTFAGVLGGRRRDALSSSLGSRRGRSAENTFVRLLRGRPRSRLVELDVPPRTARGRPSREFSAAGRDALSSSLGSRRGRSAEKTFATITAVERSAPWTAMKLRGPRSRLVELDVPPRTARGRPSRPAEMPCRPAWGPAAEGPGKTFAGPSSSWTISPPLNVFGKPALDF